MISFIIEDRYGDTIAERYSPGSVLDFLTDKLDVDFEVAMDAEGWCELASVGEIYQEEMFRIRVEEE